MTKREEEVLKSLLQGNTNKQIAKSLGISDFTVRDHVSSILRKTGAGSRAKLFAAEIEKERTLTPTSIGLEISQSAVHLESHPETRPTLIAE